MDSVSNKTLIIIIVSAIVFVAFALLLKLLLSNAKDEKEKLDTIRELNELEDNLMSITPEQLFEIRERQKGFTGIYIILNKDKDMVYVGQAQNVFNRANNHFTGKGNGDVYADYKYGDRFIISFISLVKSGFDNLDDLERYYIEHYKANETGYNKNKGNK